MIISNKVNINVIQQPYIFLRTLPNDSFEKEVMGKEASPGVSNRLSLLD